MENTPGGFPGVFCVCVRRCPTFPPVLGSIIGAGRLSFRVRDGSGRFPAAMAAVTFYVFCRGFLLWGVWCLWWWCGCGLWVSFRPVSASSLSALLRVQVWSIDPVVCGGPYPT